MKILLSLTIISLLILAVVIYRGFKNIRKDSAEKAFYDLWWKIEYSLRNSTSEKYLKEEFERLRKRKDINQGLVDRLEDKFKFKFEIDTDEFDPDSVFL